MSYFQKIISKYVCSNGVQLIAYWLQKYPFEFKIVNPRSTKFGDYRYNPRSNNHIITINNDLKGDAFLFTALHEIAHQHTQILHGRVQPHGVEWKNCYKKLLMQALENNAFENAQLIVECLDSIKSSSVYNKDIFKELYSSKDKNEVYLEELNNGDLFIFNKVMYQKKSHRRTRVLCFNTENRKDYLIPNLANVLEVKNE